MAAVKYNLRLSDGAELVLGYDDLRTWLVDDGARVQLVGSNEWHLLKAFLAPSDPLDPSRSEPQEPRPLRPQPSLMVLADDLGDSSVRSTVQTFAPGDDLPIIRLKPPDDPQAPPAARGAPAIAAEVPDLVRPAPWQDPRDEKLFAAIAAFGGFLSVWLYRLDRQLKRFSWLRP